MGEKGKEKRNVTFLFDFQFLVWPTGGFISNQREARELFPGISRGCADPRADPITTRRPVMWGRVKAQVTAFLRFLERGQDKVTRK